MAANSASAGDVGRMVWKRAHFMNSRDNYQTLVEYLSEHLE
jgi:hypothetical protein